MTSYCKRCREQLQDNQTDGEPFLKRWTKNPAYLVEQNKTKRECDFIQTSRVNNQRENSPPQTTGQLLNYRTALTHTHTIKKIINQSTLIWKASIYQKWSSGNFQTPTVWKREKNLSGFDIKLDQLTNLCFTLWCFKVVHGIEGRNKDMEVNGHRLIFKIFLGQRQLTSNVLSNTLITTEISYVSRVSLHTFK